MIDTANTVKNVTLSPGLPQKISVMTQSIFDQLDASGLFAKFPDAIKAEIATQSQRKQFTDGDVVYRSGDAPAALYGVLSGGIKLTGEDASGKYYLYGVIQPGWWFGEISVLDGLPRAQYAVSIGHTELVLVPRKLLMDLLEIHPELYRHFVAVLCNRLRQAGAVLEEVAFLPISLRLAKHLLRLQNTRKSFPVKLSQEELAASLGVTRQSISRVLKQWEQQHWVKLSYGDIEITQAESLRQLLESGSGK